jgi:hypothetical protein
VLLSSEKTLARKVVGEGGEWTGSMAVRFPDVDCSDVDAKVPRETLEKIAGIYHHFGHIGGPYITAFKADGLHHEPHTSELRSRILAAAETIAGGDPDGARRRAALPFALILISGVLAQRYRLLPATAKIEEAVKWGWGRYSASVEAQALAPQTQALENLRRWIAEHWESALKKIEAAYHNSRDAVGWYDEEAIYIPTGHIADATGGVLSRNAIVDVLKKRALLLRCGDDRPPVRHVPGIGRVDAYVLKRRAFRDE